MAPVLAHTADHRLPWFQFLGGFTTSIGGHDRLTDRAKAFARHCWEQGSTARAAAREFREAPEASPRLALRQGRLFHFPTRLPWPQWYGGFVTGIGKANETGHARDYATLRYAAGATPGQAAADYRAVLMAHAREDWITRFVLAGGPDPHRQPTESLGRVVAMFVSAQMGTKRDPEAAAAEWLAKTGPDGGRHATTLAPRTFADVGARSWDELAGSLSLALIKDEAVKRVWAHAGTFYGCFGLEVESESEQAVTLYRLLPEAEWATLNPGRPAETYNVRKARTRGTRVGHLEHPGGLVVVYEGVRYVIDEGKTVTLRKGGM